MAAVRERSLAILDGFDGDRTLVELVDPPRAAAQRDDAPDAVQLAGLPRTAPARSCRTGDAPPGPDMVRVEAGPFEMGSPGRGLRLRQRARLATSWTLPAFEIDRLPVTVGDWIEFMDAEGAAEPLHWNGTAPDPRAAGHARLVGRGDGIRALPRQAAADRGRVGEGRVVGSRDRRVVPLPVGRGARPRRRWRTSTRPASGPAPAGAYADGAVALRRARDGRRPVGVDEQRVRPRTPASAPTPIASTRRCSSDAATASCAAARGPPARGSPTTASATGICRSGARSSRGSDARRDRQPPVGRRARLAGGGRPPRDGSAAEGDPAEVLLRRARLGALRADHDAARVLPDPLRASATEPPRARDRGADRGRGAGRARLGDGVEDARAPVRDGRPRTAARVLAVRRARRRSCASASTCSPISSRGSRCTAWSATSSRTSSRSLPAASA